MTNDQSEPGAAWCASSLNEDEGQVARLAIACNIGCSASLIVTSIAAPLRTRSRERLGAAPGH